MLELLQTLLVYATQVLAGLLAVRALRGGSASRGWRAGPGLWARVLLLGPGALAAQMLLYGMLGVPFTLPLVLGPWWIAGGLAAALRRSAPLPAPLRRGPAFGALVALAVALVVIAFAGRAGTPIHDGDEMHNFAVTAKFFAAHAGLAPAQVVAMVDPGRNEYPPLVALNEALLFLAGEALAPWSARPFFGLAHLALCLLAVDLLWSAAAKRSAFLLGVLVVAAPGFATYAADGRPDLRLAATVLLLGAQALDLQAGGIRAALRFAAAAGLCALTKNEGIALAAAALGFLLVRQLHAQAGTAATLAPAAVIAVLAGAWPIYRALHGIRDEFSADAWTALDPAAALGRLPEVARRFAAFAGFGAAGFWSWGLLWPIALLAGARAAFRRGSRAPACAVAGALAAHLALYATTFAVTPYDLDWHLGTAGARLLMHATPWLILLCALGLPADAVRRDLGPPERDPATGVASE